MKYSIAAAAAAYSFVTGVAGHGYIMTPEPRHPGDAMKAACGQQIYNNQASDDGGNIQGELQNKQADYNETACHIWQCKGYQFADNTANVHSYSVGEVVPIYAQIRAPHTGTANVSIVDTASDTIVGSILKSWAVYASTSTPITQDQTNFNVTIPDLGGKCTTAGECVIQWWWDASSIDQTYEACIDFTVGGGSGSSATSSAVASSTKIAPTTTSAAGSTSLAAVGSSTTSASVSVTASIETGVKVPTTTTGAPTSAAATSAAAEKTTLSASNGMKLICYEEL